MNLYTILAKKSIETYINTGKIIEVPEDLSQEFYQKRAGVFVTIYKLNDGKKELRGCIGTFLPTKKNIAQEIISNAISAATRDYRFEPITRAELNNLIYEVSILTSPQPVDNPEHLDPKKYGVIVKTIDGRCGLLLPDIDGVESTEQQVFIACQKGAINPTNDKILLYRFSVEKY